MKRNEHQLNHHRHECSIFVQKIFRRILSASFIILSMSRYRLIRLNIESFDSNVIFSAKKIWMKNSWLHANRKHECCKQSKTFKKKNNCCEIENRCGFKTETSFHFCCFIVSSSTMATTDTKVSTQDFIQAFNKQRTTLAGFAKCANKKELDVVRDGFYLGLAKDLCPDAYKAVLLLILRKKFGKKKDDDDDDNDNKAKDEVIVEEGDQGMLSMSFEEMVLAARACDEPSSSESDKSKEKESDTQKQDSEDTNTSPTTYWKDLVDTVLDIGQSVGSDLESIWKTLEDGRLSWLGAANAAHPIKLILKKALEDDNALESAGDVSDAMMVWIYSICLALSEGGKESAEEIEETTTTQTAMGIAVVQWATAVNMTDKHNPLNGYQAELWDPRKDEWRALDLGAQQAAESGGANLLEAWKA